MSRFSSFVIGFVLGGVVVFTSLKYHVLRTDEGFQLVPKLSATFSRTYYDVRGFDLNDWAQHRTLSAAVVQANKEHLFKGAAADSLTKGLESVLNDLGYREGS